MAELSSSKMDLHALIKDSIRALYHDCADPTVTLATHDKLWWVVIFHRSSAIDRMHSGQGFATREAALENMLRYFEELIW
ncbi:hypothetical protein M436DRAFT_84901 [Aureobasidium namibiae CBS 147.97]|uniref:Uncharacterized protein n=1 Tax=Aureobasidium namibiae CBS 147.97 TaxID=1043004 RepID=A0A074W9R4_9PEZI|nr:uncharacterized protein M436DRAFT_84901 [Aureobasidium namibiae CBS 147.97]KEQ69845.1 hypothetical protein M436DRAFT_84901 [Aureobasidium namibiae CBS 147.97]